MRTLEYGPKSGPTVMLLHGGGLGPWTYWDVAARLGDGLRVILPILDGHAGSDRGFTTIEDNARELIGFIDAELGGHVRLLGGLSLGGQILLTMLSQRGDICSCALIESALALPMPVTAALVAPTMALCAPLVRRRSYARLQFAALHLRPELFCDYYASSADLSRANLTAMLKANAAYEIKDTLSDCRARALVLAGGRERPIMQRSARLIGGKLGNAAVEIMPGRRHGEMSLNHPDEYAQRVLRLVAGE